jgi:CRP/FNR family transcriptional regulator, anaerobic regulatory protein
VTATRSIRAVKAPELPWIFFMKSYLIMDGIVKLKSWMENHYDFLTEEDFDYFRPFMSERTIRKDEFLLEAGHICREMSFVLSGAFRMYCLFDGKEINVTFFLENEFIVDHDSFFSRIPGRNTIQAIENATVVTFSHEVLIGAYNRSKNWERLGRLLAQESSGKVSGRLEKLLFMSGKERYLHMMREQPELLNRVPLYHLASYLGMERESLSRIRQRIGRR